MTRNEHMSLRPIRIVWRFDRFPNTAIVQVLRVIDIALRCGVLFPSLTTSLISVSTIFRQTSHTTKDVSGKKGEELL